MLLTDVLVKAAVCSRSHGTSFSVSIRDCISKSVSAYVILHSISNNSIAQITHCSLKLLHVFRCLEPHTAELQWLEHLWNHENMFERGVVRANEC